MRVASWRKLSAEELILSNYGGGSRSDSKESACNSGDLGLIPELGRSPGEGDGNPLHYSGLENSMGYTVHGFAESDTTEQLSLSRCMGYIYD